MKAIQELQQRMNYQFSDEKLLITALTHSSYANEHKTKSNERLEFLGDSVLGLIVGEYLFSQHTQLPEGELTKIRAGLVCEKSLFEFATQLNLGDAVFVGKGEEVTGGRKRPSLLADAFEAVLAAVYLDSDLETARAYLLKFIQPQMLRQKKAFVDYKTILQEIIQQNKEERVEYHLQGEEGPDHDKKFFVRLCLNSNELAVGVGKSKKEAEQNAAKQVLELMGRTFD